MRPPVVASSVGGLIDTVVEDATGLHVRPATRTPWPPPSARSSTTRAPRRLRTRRRERAEARYTWHKVAAESERVYERLVAGAANGLAAPVAATGTDTAPVSNEPVTITPATTTPGARPDAPDGPPARRPRCCRTRRRGPHDDHRAADRHPRAETGSASVRTVVDHIAASVPVIASLVDHKDHIAAWADDIAARLVAGRRLLAAGNGGSAAEAQHLTSELTGRFDGDRPAYSAISLHAESSAVTAIGNDYGYDQVFARQVTTAHARAGDVVVLLSTSGKSPNLLRAAEAARPSVPARSR